MVLEQLFGRFRTQTPTPISQERVQDIERSAEKRERVSTVEREAKERGRKRARQIPVRTRARRLPGQAAVRTGRFAGRIVRTDLRTAQRQFASQRRPVARRITPQQRMIVTDNGERARLFIGAPSPDTISGRAVSAEELGFARPREAQGDFLLGNIFDNTTRKKKKGKGGRNNFGIF